MAKLHLIRHGKTSGTESSLYYGSSDIPLSKCGVDDIKNLVKLGIYPEAECFFTTGLLRTEQTFELIYGNKPHEKLKELQEYDFGDFEMRTYEAIKDLPGFCDWINDPSGKTPCPGGESHYAFARRVQAGYARILQCADKDTVVICHGGVISQIMLQIFEMPDKSKYIWLYVPKPGRGYTLDIEGGKAVSFAEITD